MVMTCAVSGPGMGDSLRERLPTLWRRIEDAHYSYLETEDSPEKLQQKKKLEGYIMEYLNIVPHDCKFGLPETTKVFNRTLKELPDYSAYRAGLGWAALARYAANLLAQPWRKEYKVIRLYCGYFKHEVEANMVGAETLLQALGYKSLGSGRLALMAPVCPDMVAAMSRDALIAHTECQIMAQIWETAWKSGARMSWAEVARERASRCMPQASSTGLYTIDSTYNMDGSEIYSNIPASIASEAHSMRNDARYLGVTQCNHMYPKETLEEPIVPIMHQPYIITPNVMQQMMYSVSQRGDIPMTIPQCGAVPVMPIPCYYPVQTPYMIPTPVYAPIKQANTVPINGYPPVPQYRYDPVPTAQLIELDPPSDYEHGRSHRDEERQKNRRQPENFRRNSTSKSGFSDVSLPSLPRSDTQPTLSKAREDGMGTYESWDYVFRNLSSKDQDESRSRISPSLDRDSRTLDRLDREDRRTKFQQTTLDLEDGLQALNLDRSHDEDAYRTAKVNENLMRLKQEQQLKRAKQLAKKQAEEKKAKRIVEPVPNPKSDALISTKLAPDKMRLLSKKDVKDRKEIIKQQNGTTAPTVLKVMKDVKRSVQNDKPDRIRSFENGVYSSMGHSSKSLAANPPSNYDLKTQLVVTLDETDSNHHSPSRSQRNVERERSTSSSGKDKQKRDRWECTTCTYLNSSSLAACEMCGKSKKGPEIQPLMSGGRECPACTLVNKRDATVCDACATGLEHCPTYI